MAHKDPGLPAPGGLEQPLGFIEPDAPGGYIELLGKLADTESSFFAHDGFPFFTKVS